MRNVILSFLLLSNLPLMAQFNHSDSIRGSITPERSWWNLTHYDLHVKVHPEEKSISGYNVISFNVLNRPDRFQIDLQAPLHIDSVLFLGEQLKVTSDGPNAHYVMFPQPMGFDEMYSITVYYSGTPTVAKRPPWDGGLVWKSDANGNPIITTACQGIGASIWWPCKDHMYDEPENGMNISITSPKEVMNVSNGRFINDFLEEDETRTTVWEVKNPINNYGVNMNIADYAHWDTIYKGEKGDLAMNFYVYQKNLEKSKTQFKDALRTLEAFEYWFGPYPFYEDGYKLVEVPYLGMEHQSSVTYGNGYRNGYLGTDLSGTGWGLKWDYIIIHESGHEWFANNITYKDIADMWIHESFTTYSEGLFTEYFYGKEAGAEYIRGLRRGISNDKPLIGNYDVNHEGSGDMYPKGANLLHTMRQIIANDSLWRSILRGLNEDFYHQTVTTQQIEDYISHKSGIDFNHFFDQYLRTANIPTLEIEHSKKTVRYRWTNVVKGFDMPIDVEIDGKKQRIYPTTEFQQLNAKQFKVDENYYVFQK